MNFISMNPSLRTPLKEPESGEKDLIWAHMPNSVYIY